MPRTVSTPAEGYPVVTTASPEIIVKNNISRKKQRKSFDPMHHTTFQARLGRRLDYINRQVTDNNIRLSSHPTDMIRLHIERDPRSRDLVYRQIEGWEVLPIILPPLKDIPLRHFVREGSEIQIPSLFTIDQQAYMEIYAPAQVKLEPEDLLFRMIYDPNADEPYILCLQVKEQLATIGYSTINYLKYFVTIFDEKIPKTVVSVLKEANERREELGW